MTFRLGISNHVMFFFGVSCTHISMFKFLTLFFSYVKSKKELLCYASYKKKNMKEMIFERFISAIEEAIS